MKQAFTTLAVLLSCCNITEAQWNRADSSELFKFRNGVTNVYSLSLFDNRVIGCGSYMNTDTTGWTNYLAISPVIVYSSDSGRHWIEATYPITQSKTLADNALFSTATFPSGSCLAVGSRFCFRSSDGGMKWDSVKQQNSMSRRKMRYVYTHGIGQALITCIDGFVTYYSENGGLTWRNISSGELYSGTYYETIGAFVDSNTVFISRYNMFSSGDTLCGTRFDLTTDRGATWQRLGCTVIGFVGDSSNDVAFSTVKFSSNHVGYALGGMRVDGSVRFRSAVFKTLDGGRSWKVIDSAQLISDTYEFLTTLSIDTILVGSSLGVIRVSTDGGQRWQTRNSTYVKSPFGNDANDVFRSMLFFGVDRAMGCVQRFGPNEFISYEYKADTMTPVEREVSKNMNSFPVPASETLHVVLPKYRQCEVNITIRNIIGNMVFNRVASSEMDDITIPVYNWESGVYLLSINCPEIDIHSTINVVH